MATWRIRIARWIIRNTNTHSEYLIIIDFLMQQWLYERAWMLRCTYIARLVITEMGCVHCAVRTEPVSTIEAIRTGGLLIKNQYASTVSRGRPQWWVFFGGVLSTRTNAQSVPKIYVSSTVSHVVFPKINFKISQEHILPNVNSTVSSQCCPPITSSNQTHNLFPLLHAPSCQLLITLPSSVPNRVLVYSLCLTFKTRASCI
jgi:hypothetical protein